MAEGKLLGDAALSDHVAGLIRAHHAAADTGAEPATAALASKLTALLDSLQEGMAQDDRTFLFARRL